MGSGHVGGTVEAVRIVEDEVRELIRRRGLDPLRQSGEVRRLVEEAISDYDERALLAPLPPIGPLELARRFVFDAVAGFGPLQPLLDDPGIEEIWLNAPNEVYVARNGESELTSISLTEQQVRDLVERMLKSSGRRLDLSSPFVDATLPSGHRLHVVLDSIARGFLAVNIRKFVVKAARLEDLVTLGSITPAAARFLDACVVAGLNIVVSGGTQAGKTTMLNTLGSAVPGGERIVSAEEVYELRFSHPDWVQLQTRQAGLAGTGEIKLRHLVKEALRMRPSRIVVGEVRAEEALDLLLALNSGLPGMATIHANSAREALVKLCTLPLLAGENISARFVVPTVAASIDLVVHLGIETEPIFERRGGELRTTGGRPPHPERYERAGLDVRRILVQEH